MRVLAAKPHGRSRCVTSGRDILSAKGMERRNQSRVLVAVCLSVLFCFSSLAALAAESADTALGIGCCHTKTKCCCRKHHDEGPAFSGNPCGRHCDAMLPGTITISGHFPRQSRLGNPAEATVGAARKNELAPASRLFPQSLWQRPPPSGIA